MSKRPDWDLKGKDIWGGGIPLSFYSHIFHFYILKIFGYTLTTTIYQFYHNIIMIELVLLGHRGKLYLGIIYLPGLL